MTRSTFIGAAIAILIGIWAVTFYLVFNDPAMFWILFAAFGLSIAILGWIMADAKKDAKASFFAECIKTKSIDVCVTLANTMYQ